MDNDIKYRSILLKISGECLADPNCCGVEADKLKKLAREISEAAKTGCRIGLVVGGGNIIRGAALASEGHIPQASADHMGMLGTIINGIAITEALDNLNQPVRLMSAIGINGIAEQYARGRAMHHMHKGRVVVLAGGTGNPFCTTDTAAALRAAELHCEVILKATKVDGVYSEDPKVNPQAQKYDHLTFAQAIKQQLRIMDLTAFSMCMNNNLPIIVFNYNKAGNIKAVVQGKDEGTLINNS